MNKAIAELAPEDVLRFWFGEDPSQPLAMAENWFKKNEAFDWEIMSRFGDHVARAAEGDFTNWRERPEAALALIIMLDQFPRNLHRDSALAFAHDKAALDHCLYGLNKGHDAQLAAVHRSFFYMPLMHNEALEYQRLSVEKFSALVRTAPSDLRKSLELNHRFAVAHMELIERFGRFPHRNAVLNRPNTPEESTYLESPDAGF